MIISAEGAFRDIQEARGEPSLDADEVATARAYLSKLRRGKRPDVGSYALKHAAERWGERNGMASYVSNGALIRAAVDLGIAVRLVRGGPNCDVAVDRQDFYAFTKFCADPSLFNRQGQRIDYPLGGGRFGLEPGERRLSYARSPLSLKLRFEILSAANFTCRYCGRKAPEVTLEVDHIIPVSKGGTNHPVNLVAACFDCNRGKRDREITQ